MSNSNLASTGPGCGCEICGDISRNCRRNDEINLCMTFADAKIGEIVNGYKLLKHTKDRLWGVFKFDNSQEWSNEQRKQWRQDKLRRQQHQTIELDLRQKQSLSEQERHEQYTKLLEELTLHPEDERDILRRGFSHQEIDLGGWKSVDKYQELRERYSSLLPGISGDGKLILTNAGWLCPVRNRDGLIVAIQVRLRAIGKDEGRYRWLSSRNKNNPNGQSPHVYPFGANDGELPLACFSPKEKRKGIALAEGTGAKPFYVANRLGMLTIGAAGGQWASSPATFKESLDDFSQKMGGLKHLTIYPDAGDVLNGSVMERWRRVILLLENWGWTAKFAWWDQVTKEANDVDELNHEELQNISYVTPDYFWKLANEEKRKISLSEALIEDENLPSGFREDWQRWLNSKKYTPDITVHQDEFTFPPIPDSGVIVAVNSGLGTHKTGAMIAEIAKTQKGVRIIGYRNNLLLQTASRAASMRDIKVYHLNNDDAKDLVSDESTHLLFCVDSIEHVDGHFAGRDIYLDENCSVLLHTINGGTLGNNQAKVIKIFTRALEVCNRIFLLDGNLSDLYVDFVAKLAKNKQVIKIKNTKKIPPHQISFIEGIDPEGEIKKRDKSALVQYLCSQGVKSWIACDSKTFALTLDKLLLDLGKFGFCLNSESVGEEWAKEFMMNPDQFIEIHQPEYIIVSPTAESGVSVTSKHFTDKMSFFVGVQNTNSQHQQMFRLRDNSIPHYVVCPERSMIKERSTPQTYFDKTFSKILNDRVSVSARMAAFDSGNSDRVLEVISKALTRNQDDWWDFSGRLGALDNFEMKHLRLCLIHALEEAGHKVEIIEWDTSREYSDLLKGAKEAVQMQHAQELFVAIPFETVEEANQAAKKNPRKPMQRRIEKTRLLDRLPGIESEKAYGIDFIYERHIKNKHFITQQQRFFFLNNFEISQKRHEVDWYYKATAQDFFTGTMKKISHLDIWALKELDILQFTQGEWHKDLSQVNEFIQKAREPEIVKALNMKPDPESATGAEKIKYISSLLDLIGLKFAKSEQKMVDGIRRRVYTVNPEIMNHPDRLAVLAAVDRKMTEWMADESKSKVEWNEQELERPEPLVAPCLWGVKPQPESSVGNPPQPKNTTPPTYLKPEGGVFPKNQDQQPIDISEYMTKEYQQGIASDLEYITTLAKTDHPLAMEALKDIRQWMPTEALKAAANLLPKPLRTQIADMVKLQDFPNEPSISKPDSHTKSPIDPRPAPLRSEPFIATCVWGVKPQPKPKPTTPHIDKKQGGNVPPESLIELPNQPQHTISPINKNQGGSVQPGTYVESSNDPCGWMEPESLKVIGECLMPIPEQIGEQAVNSIKELLAVVPIKALFSAAQNLADDLRLRIESLLSQVQVLSKLLADPCVHPPCLYTND